MIKCSFKWDKQNHRSFPNLCISSKMNFISASVPWGAVHIIRKKLGFSPEINKCVTITGPNQYQISKIKHKIIIIMKNYW